MGKKNLFFFKSDQAKLPRKCKCSWEVFVDKNKFIVSFSNEIKKKEK